MAEYIATEYWTGRFRRHGHTGDVDEAIYAYDQPQRLRAVRLALTRAGVSVGAESRVLDVGCGTGDLIALLAAKGVRHVTAVELSDEIISYVRTRFAGGAVQCVLKKTAIEDAELSSGNFELACCINVLQHINGDESFLRAVGTIVQAVRDCGHILLMEFSPWRQTREATAAYLKIRTRGQYIGTFQDVGCKLVCEVGLPRLGVRLVRLVGRCALSLRHRSGGGEAVGDAAASARGRFVRVLEAVGKAAILGLAKPLDYLLVPFPAPHTDMRILVFQKNRIPGRLDPSRPVFGRSVSPPPPAAS